MRPGAILPAVLAAWILTAWSLAAAPARAAATVVSAGPETVALTVYHVDGVDDLDLEGTSGVYGPDGLALISEWRTVEVPAGETVLRFEGVAEGIVPQTAALDGLPAKLVESNQDYDLLSPGSLVSKSIGTKVQRITINPVTGKETVEDAIIRSGPAGVVLEVNGRFEAIGCGGPPQRLVFPRPPEGLSDRPTLSLRLRVERAGRYRVRLTYLATGLLWRTRYVMTLSPDASELSLTGWITLINTSGTSFVDAPTQVVAGDVATSDKTVGIAVQPEMLERRCWPMDTTTTGRRLYLPAPQPAPPPPPSAMYSVSPLAVVVTGSRMPAEAAQSELGDYKLYTLPSPTTVAARQTKQVLMLSRPVVKAQWLYVYRTGVDAAFDARLEPEPAQTVLRTTNIKAQGLGAPLPAGRVSFMQPGEDGRPLLVGEGDLWASAIGGPIQIVLDEDPDIQVFPLTRKTWKRGRRLYRSNQVEVRNNKAEAVVFEFRLAGGDTPYRITAQSLRSKTTPDGRVWSLAIPAGAAARLSYTVQTVEE